MFQVWELIVRFLDFNPRLHNLYSPRHDFHFIDYSECYNIVIQCVVTKRFVSRYIQQHFIYLTSCKTKKKRLNWVKCSKCLQFAPVYFVTLVPMATEVQIYGESNNDVRYVCMSFLPSFRFMERGITYSSLLLHRWMNVMKFSQNLY